jgi:hypothetical protein
MMGKFLASFIVVCGVLAGGGMYYLQVYAFYDAVVPNGSSDVVLTKKIGQYRGTDCLYKLSSD